jgi:hypothetical protein
VTGAEQAIREPEKYKNDDFANKLRSISTGAFNSGTHIGNAVGQSFTYTASNLNV